MALTKAQLVDLNANELIIDLDADTSITADTDDQIDIKIAGADDFTFTANTFTALSGSSIVTPTLSVTSSATISGGAIALAAIDIDGGTDIGAAVADADLFIIDDGAGGTNRKVTASRVKTYMGAEGGAFSVSNLDIDGATDIGAGFADADLLIIDDGAGGTNRKVAASRIKTYIGASTAADDLTIGDAAVTLSTSSGNITIDATANDTDIIFKGTDNNSDITMLTLDGSEAGAATFNNKIIATELDISGDVDVDGTLETDALSIASTAVTTTAAEINLIDGGTARGTTAVASGDGILINDGGTMRMTNVDTVSTYFAGHSVGGSNIVTTGALDSGSITSGFGAIDNGTSNIRSATITAETAFVPDAANGASLGTTSLEFADLYLHDGAQILWGADQDVLLTHVADAGLSLKTSATGDDTKATLTLQTGETDIAQDDVLGAIDFQAPDEGTGTDAILVAAGIAAVSEGDFSSSNNATKLSFKTAASEAAAEKASLSSTGVFTATSFAGSGSGLTAGTTPLTTLDIDGGTDIGADIVDADLFIIDDGAGGTNRKTAASRLKTYIGSAAILQVVSVQDLTVRSTTSTSYTKASNGYDLNITPTSASSNILLEASFGGGIDANNNRAFFTIFRDSTDLGNGGDGVTTSEITGANSSESSLHLLVSDGPSTTSQITYSIQMKGQGGNTVYMNQKGVGCFVAYEISG